MPPSFNVTCPFQTVQRRVKGALFKFEVAAASLLHFFDDLVAVHGLQLQQSQEHALSVTFEQFLLMHSPLFVVPELRIHCISG